MNESDITGMIFTVSASTGGTEDFKLTEDEFYPCVLTSIEKFENPNQKYGPSLNWNFELEGEQFAYEWEGKIQQSRVRGSTSMTFSPKSKLYAWYSKLNGAEPKEGEQVTLKHLIGLRCMIMVKGSKGKDKAGNEKIWYNVEKVKLADNSQIVPKVAPVVAPVAQTAAVATETVTPVTETVAPITGTAVPVKGLAPQVNAGKGGNESIFDDIF